MVVSKRAVVLRSLLSVVLLLAALAPYGAMLAGMQDGAFVSIFATPIFLVSSQIASIGAITSATASRVAEANDGATFTRVTSNSA